MPQQGEALAEQAYDLGLISGAYRKAEEGDQFFSVVPPLPQMYCGRCVLPPCLFLGSASSDLAKLRN